MSISFSGSTLTFSDSTTMTTAATAGPPGPTGPTGPTGSTGPTGAAGSNASVVTTFGAVGTYVTAYYSPGACVMLSPGNTVSGASLYKPNVNPCIAPTYYTHSGYSCTINTNVGSAYFHAYANCCTSSSAGKVATWGLSGTWRSMGYISTYNVAGWYGLGNFLRVS
jgi:hypothetical protein